MKNECSSVVGAEKPFAQYHKPLHEQNTHIVVEAIDGQVVETRLPKEQAQKLFKKIIDAGGDATIEKAQK